METGRFLLYLSQVYYWV